MTALPLSRLAGDEREAFAVLATSTEPADTRVGALVAEHGALGALDRLRALPAEQQRYRELIAYDDVAERAAAVGARIVVRGDAEWPTQLDDLDDTTPLALWVVGAGDLRLLALRSLAVVGARASTPYGESVARMWCSDLAEGGWTVISGGAYGIDAVAHRAALDAGGVTIAVLATGVDVPYPRAHAPLIARIAEQGLVVSESPPGSAAHRQRFLTRNRVIAAMTRATLVVEAAWRSGTMSTALSAMRTGRTVLAVPGSVHAAASAGCHRLIREHGALIAAQVDDVADALRLPGESRLPGEPRPSAEPSLPRQQRIADTSDDVATSAHDDALLAIRRPTTRPDPTRSAALVSTPVTTAFDALPADQRLVVDALPRRGARSVDDLLARTGLPMPRLLAALGALQTTDWLRRTDTGYTLTRNPAQAVTS